MVIWSTLVITGSSRSLMQQTLGRRRAHMFGIGVVSSCLLGCRYKGLQFWRFWAQTNQCTWYILCIGHHVAAGVCNVVWAVHSSHRYDIFHSSIIYQGECVHQVWDH